MRARRSGGGARCPNGGRVSPCSAPVRAGSRGLSPGRAPLAAAHSVRDSGLEVTYATKRARDRAAGQPDPPPEIEEFLRKRFLANSPESLAAMSRTLAEPPTAPTSSPSWRCRLACSAGRRRRLAALGAGRHGRRLSAPRSWSSLAPPTHRPWRTRRGRATRWSRSGSAAEARSARQIATRSTGLTRDRRRLAPTDPGEPASPP